jgi:PAS domain S-box-containing protein
MHILYVEDNPMDADLAHRALAQLAPHIRLECADTLAAALARLASCTPQQPCYDLVLADLRLPDGSGISLLPHLQERNLPIALVVLTGSGSEEAAVAALKAGASDYVVKRGDYLARLPKTLEAARQRYQAEAARRARPLRVLYAEHNAANVDLTRRQLGHFAPFIQLETVTSAEQVLRRLPADPQAPQAPCDVLLLDYNLPGMIDLELLKELLQTRGLDLPVVFVTGQGDEEVALQALRLGALDYLGKHAGYLYRLPAVLENAFHRAQAAREHAALQASEQYFRSLIENISDLILVVDAESTVRYASPSVERVLGYQPEQMVGTRGFAFVHPDDLAAVTESFTRALGNPGVPCPAIELRQRHRDGSWRRMEGVGRSVVDGAGRVSAVVGLRDLTERKQAEAALQRRLAVEELVATISTRFINLPPAQLDAAIDEALRTVALFADADVCFLDLYDPDLTRIVACYGAKTGVAEPDWLSQTHIVGAALSEFGWAIDQLQRGQVVDVPSVAQLFPGDNRARVFWVSKDIQSILIIPLCQDENLIGALGFHSLHREQNWPAEYHSLLKLVGHIVLSALARKRVEEDRDRLQAQFLQAQKMQAVGQLTAGIAHDFNNLLTAINGFAELAQFELSADDPLQDWLGKILHSGRRAADLVRQLLAFSRKQIVELQVVALNAIVENMDQLLRRIIGESVHLKAILAHDLWPVKIDPSQIEQVIVNLAINARDAMPGGGHLTIETANVELDEASATGHAEVQPGPHVLLAVSDDGTGMTEEVKAHLFEPFFTTKGIGRGTGLGLATIFGIIKQSGGHIWVDSEPGQGSTFKVYLPRSEGTVACAALQSRMAALPSGHEVVMLVEDDGAVRELAERVLRQQGYSVISVADGQEALHLAEACQAPIQLLLTDLVMPGLSGQALAERLIQQRPDLKVVFMSGYADDVLTSQAMAGPGRAFLQKPFSSPALARKVRAVLDS